MKLVKMELKILKSLFLFLLAFSTSNFSYALNYGTWNIRNFDYDTRSRVHTDKLTLERVLKSLNFDILGVNEINDAEEFARVVNSAMSDFSVVLSKCGGAHGQRLGFIYNKKDYELLSFNEDITFSDPGGDPLCNQGSRPASIALFKEKKTNKSFYTVQVHFKAGGAPDSMNKRLKQYKQIEILVNELTRGGIKNVLVSGDFNTTGYVGKEPIDYTQFNTIMNRAKLVNLSEKIGCSAYWWGGSDDGVESPSQLDHILITKSFLGSVRSEAKVFGHCAQVSCEARPEADLGEIYSGVSDHCPQLAKLP